MSKPKVLLDTNILVSGLIFPKGNEYKILKLAEDEKIVLVLPKFVIEEAKMVLSRNFAGHEILLDVFLSKVKPTIVSWVQIQQSVPAYRKYVRDKKDTPILVSTLAAKPDFVITGDVILREDLRRCPEVASLTEICSSRQFLKMRRTSA